ncbi:MAG: hypothetical protein WC484_04755, partial [Candidatus Omnitrophota bacterium]
MLQNKRKIYYFHFLRAISVFVLFCFTTTTIAWGTPTLSTEYGVRSTEIPLSSLIQKISIPQEIGLIRDTYAAPMENNPARTPHATPVIVHIEEAHGQTEGQDNIEKILIHLKTRYGLKTVFLEGTWGKLDPESLRFLKDPKINRELLNDLNKKGLIGGAEMFLSENWDSSLPPKDGSVQRVVADGTGDSQKRLSKTSLEVQAPSPKPQGYGVENVKLYRENLEQFRKVYAAKPQTDAFLKDLRQKITDGSSREFNPELKKFFKDWAFRAEIAEQPFAGLDKLRENAGKYLSLDLSDAREQYDWPQLVRFFKLKN